MRQLQTNPDHCVRNNIVVVVCDLCIRLFFLKFLIYYLRYTLLIDRYVCLLATCLKDSSVLVRHQTLMLLTNLIKELYLKWEGSVIFFLI